MTNGTLSESTTIPLKSALPVMVTVIAATLWLSSKLNGLAADQEISAVQQDYLQAAVTDLKLDVQEVRLTMLRDRLTRSEMERWIAQARAAYPSLPVLAD